jgi:hypothetical protein
VGYVAYSKDLEHPADRRRLAAWANASGIELKTQDPIDSDVLVLSNSANFAYWLRKSKQPVILDLVDGYIGEQPRLIKDIARNVVRTFRGTSSLRWITYTKHLRWACEHSHSIIVASPEQREELLKYNSNISVILDDHSELDKSELIETSELKKFDSSQIENRIFWEGFGYTLKHFEKIAAELDSFLVERDYRMSLVTVEEFPRWGGYLGKVQTRSIIQGLFPRSWERIDIVPWSLDNLRRQAQISKFAVIPIDQNDKFAALKSENKLLSMWKLGLPTLFSSIPSYKRVASATRQEDFCLNLDDWADGLYQISDSVKSHRAIAVEVSSYLSESHSHQVLINKWSYALAVNSRKSS